MPCCESKEIRSVRVTWAKSKGSGQDSKGVEGTEACKQGAEEGWRCFTTVIMLGDGRNRCVESREQSMVMRQ